MKVSIVIPVYNAEKHIGECIGSLVAQTTAEWEAVFVDDASTDGSAGIIKSHVEQDGRIRYVAAPSNGGAGSARNIGMGEASGDWLMFLDSDDMYAPKAVEAMLGAVSAEDCDVAVCRIKRYDDALDVRWFNHNDVKRRNIPRQEPFTWKDMPDGIFTTFQHSACNKIFRRDFVERHGLRFQEIRRADDVVFTNMALALAGGIRYVDRALLTYRTSQDEDGAPRDQTSPYDFCEAIRLFRDELARAGLAGELDRSFRSTVAEIISKHLISNEGSPEHREMFGYVKGTLLPEFGLVDIRESDVTDDKLYREAARELAFLAGAPYEEYLAHRMMKYRNRNKSNLGKLRKARAGAKKAEKDYAVQSSAYRLAIRKLRYSLKSEKSRLARARKQMKKVRRSRSYRLARRLSGMMKAFRGKRGDDGE
jgi:glycosyltransferase involved in cell wall biosynthesis